MRQIGHIEGLQVQTGPLKQGMVRKIYDPGALRSVPQLRVSEYGVVGLTENGELSNDVHHAHHPAGKQRNGKNGISFNFTSHYAQMEARFGPHMSRGAAGENIIIACEQAFSLRALGDAIVIVNQVGDHVRLGQIMVAAPCEPFSRFALELDGAPAEMIKETLQFLDGGMRGFYCRLDGKETTISVGDPVYM